MITMHEAVEQRAAPVARPAAHSGSEELFDPVLRAIKACDGIGRDKTIAMVLSAVEAAFPN